MNRMSDHHWFKSSYSADIAACVEVLVFRKASRCANTSCVEVADMPDATGMAVRDSKLGVDSPILRFDASQWRRFVAIVPTIRNLTEVS